MCVGFMWMRVGVLCVPLRVPVIFEAGTLMWRSWAWCMKTVPCGIRGETATRDVTTPLWLYSSIQSLSHTPISRASFSLIQTVWPPRNSVSICWLSKYIEWMDHLLCGVRYLSVISFVPPKRFLIGR